MKRVCNNGDIDFNIDKVRGIAPHFVIKFFTTNINFFIQKDEDDVYMINGARYIKLNWSELSSIGDGVMNYLVNNKITDDNFDDNVYNNTLSRTSEYYIKSNVAVSEEEAISYADLIAAVQGQLSTIQADIDSERVARTDDVRAINSYISQVANNLATETTARTNNDNSLHTRIDALSVNYTGLTTSLSDLADKVSENEEVAARAINDLNNTISENEEVTARAINDLNTNFDYKLTLLYNTEKAERQNADQSLQEAIDAEATARQTADAAHESEMADIDDMLALTRDDLATVELGAAAAIAQLAINDQYTN